MDVVDLLRVLWRKKWLIIVTPVIAAAVALIFLQYKRDRFRSVAQISTGYTITDRINFTNDRSDMWDAEVKFSNLLALMNSSLSFNFLSYRLLLHDLDSPKDKFRMPRDVSVIQYGENAGRIREELDAKLKSFIRFGSGLSTEITDLHSEEEINRVKEVLRYKLENHLPLNPNDPNYALIREFYLEFGYDFTKVRESTVIHRLPNTDYVQVEFVSGNRDLSAYAANAFCQEFIRYYRSLKGENSTESLTYLEELVAQKKAALDEKVKLLNDLRTNSGFSNAEAGASRMGQLVELENQRNEIVSNIRELELVIERLNEELQSVSTNTPNLNNRRIVELQERINELNTEYITGGSSDKGLSDSLTFLREQLQGLIGSLGGVSQVSAAELREELKDADIDYQVEKNRLSLVDAKIRELQYGFSGYASQEAKLSAIQKEVDQASSDYQEILDKYNEARNRVASGTTLRQVLIATPAVTSISMKDVYIIGLVTMSSIALAMFVIILAGITDFSIKTPSKFNNLVKMPLLGILNKVPGRNFNISNYFLHNTNNKQIETNKSLLRQIRHEVVSMNAKTFLFTSLKPREGKSFLIFSLSYALSLLNKRILIIDTNFKRNTLTQIYGQDREEIKVIRRRLITSRRLSKAVQPASANGQTQSEEPEVNLNTYDLINPTKYKHIFFLGNAGVSSGSPAEILSSRDFKNFISIMAESFDYVFLEGAPVNEYSDTKELIRYVDKVVTVFSADSAIEPIDQESIRYLNALGRKSGGAILNKVDNRNLNL